MDGPVKMQETLMDSAACEALSSNLPMESAAYQQQLAAGGDDARRLDRDLRETVARLASASPHMAPPPDLRGRILEATAPATFRMEDYRKATQDNSRFYRWGFYAAMVFLAAGASYNFMMQNKVAQAQRQVAAVSQQAHDYQSALAAFASPHSQQITFQSNGETIGRAMVDEQAHTAVVLLPAELVPAGKTVQLTLPGADGAPIKYKTALITAPAKDLGVNVPANQTLEMVLNPKTVAPDTRVKPMVAGQ